MPDEKDFAYLLKGLSIDTRGAWQEWEWRKAGKWTGYNYARLEEYRDEVIVAYRLYNRIGLEHARRMLAKAPHTARILDAGGGTGRKAVPLALDGFEDITLLDIAPGWLKLAREKAVRAGVEERIHLLTGDIRKMDVFPKNQFDYVLALGGAVTYCGDPERALGEMSRVLKPGGELLADGIHSRFGSLRYAARAGDLETFEQLADPAQNSREMPVLLPEELEKLAKKAGLVDIHVWSEFLFEPDDRLRVGPESERWEETILKLEMRYYADPRFLGGTGLVLRASKEQ
jgi:ubiquinone/menaquinone biosynthesis C-methylase UbiE